MRKYNTRDAENAIRVKRTAAICKVDESFVYKVLKGERDSDEVMSIYMSLKEGENKLVQAVKELVPFNNTKHCISPEKYK